MAKNRSQSLRLVLGVAERAEAEAAGRLRQQRQQLQAQVSQLQQISDYNREYAEHINRLGASNVQQIMGQRNFIAQLSTMIDSQNQTVDILRQQTQKAEQQWFSLHQRKKKLMELIERLDREQDRLEQARLQKELDEMSRSLFRADRS